VTEEYLKSDKKGVIFRRICKEEEIEEIVAQKSKDEKKTEDEENFGREHILNLLKYLRMGIAEDIKYFLKTAEKNVKRLLRLYHLVHDGYSKC